MTRDTDEVPIERPDYDCFLCQAKVPDFEADMFDEVTKYGLHAEGWKAEDQFGKIAQPGSRESASLRNSLLLKRESTRNALDKSHLRNSFR